ncbi:MAG: response regulator [Nitrospirae bacterium]|nr:response regulator [Nitrospirota bacterium]
MPNIKLKKILSQSKIIDSINAICSATGEDIGIYDSVDNLIYGTISKPAETKFLIEPNIGYVTGQNAASIIASMLSAITEIELQKKTLAKEALNKYREITLIYDIAEKITSSLELNKTLNILVNEAAQLVKASLVEVYLIDHNSILYLATPPEIINLKNTPHQSYLEIFNNVITSGKVEIVNNFAQSTGASLICVPLRNKNTAIGILLVQNKKRDFYTSEDAKLLTVLSAQAAIAIDNARLYEEILKTNEQLERRVHDRTAKLSDTNVLLQKEIEQRKFTAEQLKNAQKYSQSLIESSLDMIISTDNNGKIVEFNMAAQKAFGYKRDEIIGKPTGVLYSDKEAGLKIKEQLNQSGQFSGEITSIRKDGTPFPVFISASLLKDSEGTIIGSMGVSRDITSQKIVEENLRQAIDDAERANHAKSEFLANMSHEIRTPMNGIIGMTALALETHLEPEQREYLEMVRDSADSLLDLLNSILDLSKIEAGRLTLEMTNFDLQDTIAEAASALVLQAHSKGLELLYHIYPDVPVKLIGDPTRIRQIIINLIGNAIKFTDHGEIVITLKRTDNQSNTDSAEIEFSVTDSGIGIPENKINTIFESFAQADSSTTRKYGGTGLGLTITKQLIELMGGEIKVKSVLNTGTTFLFSITLKQQPQSSVKPISNTNIDALIIDDKPLSLQILNEILCSIGVNVTEASDADTAISLLTKRFEDNIPFKVVILSSMMNYQGAILVSSHLRDNPKLAEIKIITLNTNHRSDDIEKFNQLGMTGYLFKPIKKTRLIELIFPSSIKKHVIEENSVLSITAATKKLNVLLAEDIYVNQRLAVTLLQKHGATVEVANNGREAVSQVKENKRFDLILMDLHMPEMDGITAAKIIRSFSDIPIIALTADAMKQDKDRCLDAGMNGFVSKPIKEKELFEVINSLIQTDISIIKEEPSKTLSYEEKPIIDKVEVMERLNGDIELFKEIYEAFIDDAHTLINELKETIAKNDLDKIKGIAHAIKGASAGIGAVRLMEKALMLEEMTKSHDTNRSQEIVKEIEIEFQKLLDLHM